VKAVDGISFTLDRGKTLGIVGESVGKSVTAWASWACTTAPTRTSAAPSGWTGGTRRRVGHLVRQLRGSKMAMIFQDPPSALHPYYTVGAQIAEAYRIHKRSAGSRQGSRGRLATGRHPQPADPGG
jgi:peptide/nickel transport system ATP-binding protein